MFSRKSRKGQRKIDLSVIVPVYKQEKTIGVDLRQINRALSQTRFAYEIIAVVDGKKIDRSFEEAKKVRLSCLRVIGYPDNRGKGYAVRYGMARARGKRVAFIDAGMDIDPNGISMILEHMEWYGADIIVGSKRHPASQVDYPLLRRFYSFSYHFLVRLLFGLRLKDTQTGLKVFRREVLEKVLPRLLVKRFAFDVELLAVARYLGFKKIYEAPVKLNKKRFQFSSTIKFRDGFWALWDTLAIFYRLKILRYYRDGNRRRWRYDKNLKMRINIG